MGAELGATTSIFPYDQRMKTYLDATQRARIATLAEANKDLLTADPEVEADPEIETETSDPATGSAPCPANTSATASTAAP